MSSMAGILREMGYDVRTASGHKDDPDVYIIHEDEKQISNQFSNFILVTIPNAGHWLHAENPEAFYSSVATFLS